MKKLIEVIYRLGTFLIWGVALFWMAFCVFMVFSEGGDSTGLLVGLTGLLVAFVIHQGLRWVLAPVRKDLSE